MTPDLTARLRTNAEVLSWQSRSRIAIATIAAIGELLLVATPDPHPLTGIRPVALIVIATLAYVGMIAGVSTVAARRGAAREGMLLACTLADVAFAFAMVAGVSSPSYYGRILLLVFAFLFLTATFALRRQALVAVVTTVSAYLALVQVTVARGTPLDRGEELWSVGAFLLVAWIMISEHGSLNARLARIVTLFSRAEEGDFSQQYEEHEERPDGISRVGRAYNRVRQQLSSMVLTDPLTGCLNRRGFDQAITREVARASRSGSDLALLALDIDHFKAVNDTHGHVAGDLVLRQVGSLLRNLAREGDVVARTGGEEFCIVLPDTGAAGALHLADRICDAMRAHPFGNETMSVTISMSVGVAAADRWDRRLSPFVADALKGRADEALYAAKRSGRDRARAWGPIAPEQLDLGVSA